MGFEIGPLGLISAGIYLFYMIMTDVKKIMLISKKVILSLRQNTPKKL